MPPGFADAGHGAHHYHWWLLDAERGDYAAMGHLGQFLYIDPVTNTVVVRQGHGSGAVDWLGLFRWTANHAVWLRHGTAT
jgi:CubicO group peptidase (beta-lactamase class C family)